MTNKPKINREGNKHAVSGYDICQTPPHAIEPLIPLLKRKQQLNPGMIIWESASGPEELLVKALNTHNFDVHATDLLMGPEYNFFAYDIHNVYKPNYNYAVQLTNVPFSIKYEWIEHSFELGFPFALLVPYETTFAAKFRKVAYRFHNAPWPIEKLTPERRINFKMPSTKWGVTEYNETKGKMVRRGDSAQMPVCWLTWGLNAGGYYNDFLLEYEIPMRNVRYNDDNTERGS